MEKEIIRLIDMPSFINAYTLLDENGDYNIYINARLTAESQQLALEHEQKHIKKEDFTSHEDVCILESKITTEA
jgi:hypothetical protein